jgi:molecular chaperone GrpE
MDATKSDPADRQQSAGDAEIEDATDEVAAAEEDPIAALERERDVLKEENLRLIAEGRNQAARFNRERQDAIKYANGDFARDLLVVLDDLERTRKSAETAADVESVADGVRIVYEQFLKVLKDRGVEPIEALDCEFDPSYHQALLKQPSEDHPAGQVIEEAARGYKMHGRVLRPAHVIISSGPAEHVDVEPTEATDSDAPESD